MDDSLEQPTATVSTELLNATENDEHESGDDEADDDALDWTKLFNKPTIPKRGEKQFEPSRGLGNESGLQQTILQRAREAMFTTLQATRARESKSLSYAIWIPGLCRAHITVAKGVLLANMGHSARRPTLVDGQIKHHKRLELLPEEAIYLIERGSMFCWQEGQSSIDGVPGTPMSVQHAYAEMIGKENLTIERFQVYAYLKRLGYNVTRTTPPNESYPSAAPFPPAPPPPKPSVFQTLWSLWTSKLRSLFTNLKTINWWRPLAISDKNYTAVFRSLRTIMPSRPVSLPPASEDTPYKPFWNIYKPPTPFQKSAPGPPDYQIIVVNARTTRMPSLRELNDLFDVYPEVPLPISKKKKTLPPKSTPLTVAAVPSSICQQVYLYLFPQKKAKPPGPRPDAPPGQKTNPFPALRAGRKMVIVAVVDNGSVGFYRFSEGVFGEWAIQ